MRMGLNTGPVVVGSIGDNLRMDYTAVGDTTNLAARLQQHAEPGSILVSEAVAQLVRGYITLEAMSPFAVKGKEQPVIAHRLLRTGTRRSRLAEDRTLSPFVGREGKSACCAKRSLKRSPDTDRWSASSASPEWANRVCCTSFVWT